MRDGKKDRSKVYQSFCTGYTIWHNDACSYRIMFISGGGIWIRGVKEQNFFLFCFFCGALAGFPEYFILARKVYENKDTPNNDYASVRSRLAKEKGQTDHVLISKREMEEMRRLRDINSALPGLMLGIIVCGVIR